MPTYPPHVAHFDGNQVPTMMGVVGTLGTSDLAGTANPLPIGVNPTTGAMYVQDLSGASGTSNVSVLNGTIDRVHSVGTLGSVISIGQLHNAGTIQALPNIPGGTLGQITTVNTVSNVTNGSINILTGTIQSSGTTTGVGVVSNLTNGSINILTGSIVGTVVNNGGSVSIQGLQANAAAAVGNPFPVGGTDSGGTVRSMLVDSTGVQRSTGSQVMTVGTLTTGTLQNLATGTINALASGTITGGTLINLVSGTINALAAGTITGGTLGNLNNGTLTVVSNLTNGSINLLTGTVTSVTNLAGGTIQKNEKPVNIGTSFHTRGTTGAAVWGTLIAASGAGTYQYVSNVDIVVTSGTVDVAVTNIGVGGTTGAGVLARGQFVPGGGIAKDFDPISRSGTNGTLAYWLGGAGTVDVNITYWQGT